MQPNVVDYPAKISNIIRWLTEPQGVSVEPFIWVDMNLSPVQGHAVAVEAAAIIEFDRNGISDVVSPWLAPQIQHGVKKFHSMLACFRCLSGKKLNAAIT